MTSLTPISLPTDSLLALHAANPSRYPVLLQSAVQGGPLGRFDILLACPSARLTLEASGRLHSDAKMELQSSFLKSLDAWWQRERIAEEPREIPFVGGWFLYLSYELAAEVESVLSLQKRGTVAQAIRIPSAIVVRHSDGAAWIVDETGGNIEGIRSDIERVVQPSGLTKGLLSSQLIEEPSNRYLEMVNIAKEHIAAGDIYQANLSRRWFGMLSEGVEPFHVYQHLRRANPSPFAALAVLEDFAVVSSSPERLIEVRNRNVSTRPIAGTRPRTSDHSDDDARRRELHAHPKERAEHVMLIDLERNDLGRICEAGTVIVDEFMALESYAHVHHIVSNVRGKLRSDVTPGQAIAAVFPGGTITGCPKVRCMQIISELEREPRGAYTGSMGFLNRDGSMDLNILIRTLEMRGTEIGFRAGAGIVADSIAERELEETRAKARGLIRALEG
jgi:anthranilate synthase component 1